MSSILVRNPAVALRESATLRDEGPETTTEPRHENGVAFDDSPSVEGIALLERGKPVERGTNDGPAEVDEIGPFLAGHLHRLAESGVDFDRTADRTVDRTVDRAVDHAADRAAVAPTLWLTVPAPRREPEALLELADRLEHVDHGFLWHPPSGPAVSGLGVCHRLPLQGSARFADLRHGAAEVFAAIDSATHAGALALPPRMFGGLAFDVGSASQAPWTEFGDGCFTVPRHLYAVAGELASLTLCVRADELTEPGAVEARISEAEGILALLEQLGSERSDSVAGGSAQLQGPLLEGSLLEGPLLEGGPLEGGTLEVVAGTDAMVCGLGGCAAASPEHASRASSAREIPEASGSRSDWIEQVDAIRQAIARDEVQKIVAARRSVVAFVAGDSAPQSPSHFPSIRRSGPAAGTPAVESMNRRGASVLRRLGGDRAASTRFAFCRPDTVFLGVTPEKLVSRSGRQVVTEALAGSIESGGEQAAELLDSGKDRLEQQLVVDSIVRRLEPLCASLEVAERPTVRELRDVFHLHTPIQGTLADDYHVLELAETLHPTPAVGGVPTSRAVDWIRERETHERGWYAAPIGWFDAAGDGELLVALRSCVLTRDRAYLYAGAGIVADSDPERELGETELKQRALLDALGD